jgi:hypothetical protein
MSAALPLRVVEAEPQGEQGEALLAHLANLINKAHADHEDFGRRSAGATREAGKWLLDAKRLLDHGKFYGLRGGALQVQTHDGVPVHAAG